MDRMEGENKSGSDAPSSSNAAPEAKTAPPSGEEKESDQSLKKTAGGIDLGADPVGASQDASSDYRGVRLEGKYNPVSGGKKKKKSASYWDDPSNVRTDIRPFTHAYFNVMVPRGERELFLSPGMVMKLANGEDVLFVGFVTQNGVGSSLVVASMDHTAPKLVPCDQLASIVDVRPDPDMSWTLEALKDVGSRLEEQKKSASVRVKTQGSL
jgi:hypothetical protein